MCAHAHGETVYPGSPAILREILRRQDRGVFVELHPGRPCGAEPGFNTVTNLKVLHLDGWTALHALIPPKEKRGLVLIDPPYEETNELERLGTELLAAMAKWPTGVYAGWYPIKAMAPVDAVVARLHAESSRPGLRLELLVDDPRGPDAPERQRPPRPQPALEAAARGRDPAAGACGAPVAGRLRAAIAARLSGRRHEPMPVRRLRAFMKAAVLTQDIPHAHPSLLPRLAVRPQGQDRGLPSRPARTGSRSSRPTPPIRARRSASRIRSARSRRWCWRTARRSSIRASSSSISTISPAAADHPGRLGALRGSCASRRWPTASWMRPCCRSTRGAGAPRTGASRHGSSIRPARFGAGSTAPKPISPPRDQPPYRPYRAGLRARLSRPALRRALARHAIRASSPGSRISRHGPGLRQDRVAA